MPADLQSGIPGGAAPGEFLPGGAPEAFGSPVQSVGLIGPRPAAMRAFMDQGAIERVQKHPAAVKVFRIPWGIDLAAGVVTAVTVTAAGTLTATPETDPVDEFANRILVRVSGGAAGELSRVTVTATISDGQQLIYAFDVAVDAAAREMKTKPAGASRVYRLFWGKELAGVKVNGFAVAVPSGLTLQQTLFDNLKDLVYVRLGGGVAGASYDVEGRVTTADGQTLVYVFSLGVVT